MARRESKACVTNRNLKSLSICIYSFAKRENWCNAVLIQIYFISFFLKEKNLAAFPTNGRFPEQKLATIRFWLHYQWNNHLRSIKFKWLTPEFSFRLIWYKNPPNILESMYYEIENRSIQNQSNAHHYESNREKKKPTTLEYL